MDTQKHRKNTYWSQINRAIRKLIARMNLAITEKTIWQYRWPGKNGLLGNVRVRFMLPRERIGFTTFIFWYTYMCFYLWSRRPKNAAAYQLGNTSSRTVTDIKQCWASKWCLSTAANS